MTAPSIPPPMLDRGPHWADRVVGWFASRSKVFSAGWGDESVLAEFAAPPFSPVVAPAQLSFGPLIDTHQDGTFLSPVTRLPPEVRTARVRWLHAQGRAVRSACVVLAGSREEGFRLRERNFGPLTREGLDVLLLENPYYGRRRPLGQQGGILRTVSDHALMNFATVEEARALLGWLRLQGFRRLAIAGYSMGGFMAAVVAALTEEPLAVAVLAAGAAAGPVLTQGLVADSIDFAALGGAGRDAESGRARLAALFEQTDLLRFRPPRMPAAAILVAPSRDGFVPPAQARALHAHWVGSELRWLSAGHVSAVVTCAAALRSAVRDALARLPPGALPPG